MRHRPGQYGYLPDGKTSSTIDEQTIVSDQDSQNEGLQKDKVYPIQGATVKEALKTRTFWMIALVFSFQQIAQSALMVHIVPYLESENIPRTLAAFAVTGLTVCSLAGRLGFGFLGDFKDKRYLIAIAGVLQTLGLLIFSFIDAEKIWLMALFLLTYSPGYGGPIPLRPALQADYLGTRNFGAILGLIAAVGMLGGLASPVIAGWVFDVTNSYRLVWRIFALLSLPAIPLILLIKPLAAERKQ